MDVIKYCHPHLLLTHCGVLYTLAVYMAGGDSGNEPRQLPGGQAGIKAYCHAVSGLYVSSGAAWRGP
jgi:hypothetical protein